MCRPDIYALVREVSIGLDIGLDSSIWIRTKTSSAACGARSPMRWSDRPRGIPAAMQDCAWTGILI